MRIAVIQNEEVTPVGHLDAAAARFRAVLKVSEIWKGGRLPPDHVHYDGLIVLGGAMNAEDDEGYPHLRRTANLIRHFHLNRKPVLGLCLGAQLVAWAFGAKVRRDSFGEIGFVPLYRTPEARGDPLLHDVPEVVHAIQYHHDSFELPEGAVPLMSSESCPNQAFRLGSLTYAFQAHLEASPERMAIWLELTAERLAASHPGLPERFAEDAERYRDEARAFASAVGEGWFDLAHRRAHTKALDMSSDLESYY